MRRQRHAPPTQILSQRDTMTLIALASSFVLVGFVVLAVYRNPRFFDSIFAQSVPNDAATPPAVDAGPTENTPQRSPNRPECPNVDFKLLENVQDRTKADAKDNPAIFHLFCVAASKGPAKLEKESRKDLQIANFYASPELYRGKLVHLSGALKRLVLIEIPPDKNPTGPHKFYEAWIFPDDQADVPTIVLLQCLPPGLKPGDNLHESVSFDAYFLRLVLYTSREGKGRYSPMFIGDRLHLAPALDTSRASLEALLLVAVFVALIAIVSIWGFRRFRRDERIGDHLRANLGPSTPAEEPKFEMEDMPETQSSPEPGQSHPRPTE